MFLTNTHLIKTITMVLFYSDNAETIVGPLFFFCFLFLFFAVVVNPERTHLIGPLPKKNARHQYSAKIMYAAQEVEYKLLTSKTKQK